MLNNNEITKKQMTKEYKENLFRALKLVLNEEHERLQTEDGYNMIIKSPVTNDFIKQEIETILKVVNEHKANMQFSYDYDESQIIILVGFFDIKK